MGKTTTPYLERVFTLKVKDADDKLLGEYKVIGLDMATKMLQKIPKVHPTFEYVETTYPLDEGEGPVNVVLR